MTGIKNISVSCPLALKMHNDPNDDNMSCSIEVVDNGPSRVRCFSGNCLFHGSLIRIVRMAVVMRGSPPHLVKMLKTVEIEEAVTLEGRHRRASKEIEKVLAGIRPTCDRDVLPEHVFSPFSGKIPQYAIDRGITVEAARIWGLGYDKVGKYLVFPVRRRDGKLVGRVGRAVSDQVEKPHHNYGGLNKTEHLFGAHLLEPGKPIVIVEACIDAIKTWQALRVEEACTVASLGEGWSDAHSKTISAMRPPAAYIFTDGDGAGRLMASKIAYGLHSRKVVTRLMECPWGPIIDATADGRAVRGKVDPAILPDDYILRLFREAPIVMRRVKWTNPPPCFDPDDPS
jgi:hypothetical protein